MLPTWSRIYRKLGELYICWEKKRWVTNVSTCKNRFRIKFQGNPPRILFPIFSLSGAAAAAQPERNVSDHQPGGRRGLQVPRRGQGRGGGRLVGEGAGERRDEQQWQWQRWGGRRKVYCSRLIILLSFSRCCCVVVDVSLPLSTRPIVTF